MGLPSLQRSRHESQPETVKRFVVTVLAEEGEQQWNLDILKRIKSKVWGDCDYELKRIRVVEQKAEAFLATIIHELTHAANDKLTEEEVERIEKTIAPALWAMGYRRKKT